MNITITNPRIIRFYEDNNLDFEKTNLLFLDMFEDLINSMNPAMSNVSNNLLEQINLLSKKIDIIELTTVNKINEFKKEYSEEVSKIFKINKSDSTNDILSLLERNNETIVNKILLINTDTNKNVISSEIDKFNISFKQELLNLSNKTITQKTIDNFLLIIQSNLNNISFLTEQRTDIKINDIRCLIEKNTASTSLLQSDVQEVLKKFQQVSKGKISENILHNILLKLYPSACIENLTNSHHKGDIHFQRVNKPKIIIENKSHEGSSVPTSEVEKFIKDCKTNDLSGIMFSQHRGITHKSNFEINIYGSSVLLYVSEVQYNEGIITTAIDIVEQITSTLLTINTVNVTNDTDADNTIFIDNEILQSINKEYMNYFNRKLKIVNKLDEFRDFFKNELDELELPNLVIFLKTNIPEINLDESINNNNICIHCGICVKKSLKHHQRWCKHKITV